MATTAYFGLIASATVTHSIFTTTSNDRLPGAARRGLTKYAAMSECLLSTHTLLCHPATPCAAVRGIEVTVHWQVAPQPALLLAFTLHGDLKRVLLPAPKPTPARVDGLWQHTCFEAFIGVEGDSAYREFNFAPSGDWAAYRFSAERVRDADAEAATESLAAPRITTSGWREADAFTLCAEIPAGCLPSLSNTPWPLSLTAVIELTDGGLTYWALHHPAPHPDFHLRAGWTARLGVPEILNKNNM